MRCNLRPPLDDEIKLIYLRRTKGPKSGAATTLTNSRLTLFRSDKMRHMLAYKMAPPYLIFSHPQRRSAPAAALRATRRTEFALCNSGQPSHTVYMTTSYTEDLFYILHHSPWILQTFFQDLNLLWLNEGMIWSGYFRHPVVMN